MLRFPYLRLQPERIPLVAPQSPGLLWRLLRLLVGRRTEPGPLPRASGPAGESEARPFASVRIQGPVAARRLRYALLDTGSQHTLFPAALAESLGTVLGGEKQFIRWRGQRYEVEFHMVELELADGGMVWRLQRSVQDSHPRAPLTYDITGAAWLLGIPGRHDSQGRSNCRTGDQPHVSQER